VAEFPDVPQGLLARPLTAEDLAALSGLQEIAEKVDDTGEHWSPEDLAEYWLNDLIDLAQDSVAVLTAEGALVGWATAFALPEFRDAYRVDLEGAVHPEWRGRGVGRALLGWQLARGAEMHADRHPEAPAKLTVAAHTTMPSLEAMLRRAGLTPERWYFLMERPLTDLPQVAEPAGVELVPYARDRDDEVRRTHNASFTEHHGSAARDAQTWKTFFTGARSFRPDLSVLALADGGVVGYVLAYVVEADTLATGVPETVLGQIGVLPAARGKGIAKATIGAALRAAAAAGCERAGLQVDSENVTGALRLYEGLGFSRRRTQLSWSLPLPPIGSGTAQ
jgi:mycothiol synthase